MNRKSRKDDPEVIALVLKMYEEFETSDAIAAKAHLGRQAVHDILVEQGAYQKNRKDILREKKKGEPRKRRSYHGAEMRELKDEDMLRTSITKKEIEKVRKSTKVGTSILIKTLKGTEVESSTNRSGVIRKARVISTDNPVFCNVQIEKSGLRESILWTDIIAMKRRQEQNKKNKQKEESLP